MGSCSIAVAPRNCEGIGHGFLDYMSRGMCVFAWDDATHNEYIQNGVNGVLFNNYNKIDLSKLNWRGMGLNARLIIAFNKKKWEKDKQRVLEWIAKD
jgi:hypothetical protein